MRNGYIVDALTSVDIEENVKIGGKVIRFYEGVVYGENFKISPFRKIIKKLFASTQKHKHEDNDLMQSLVKLNLTLPYGVQIRKGNNESYNCKSEQWMQTEYNCNVLEYWRLSNGIYIVKLKPDDGLESDNDVQNKLPSHLGTCILSISKRLLINFIREINGNL